MFRSSLRSFFSSCFSFISLARLRRLAGDCGRAGEVVVSAQVPREGCSIYRSERAVNCCRMVSIVDKLRKFNYGIRELDRGGKQDEWRLS